MKTDVSFTDLTKNELNSDSGSADKVESCINHTERVQRTPYYEQCATFLWNLELTVTRTL